MVARVATVLSLKFDWRLGEVVRDAMLGEERFQTLILLPNLIAFSSGLGVELFQAEDFLLKCLDILLFPLAVGAGSVSEIDTKIV